MMWNGVFINISTSCGGRVSWRLFCEFTIWFRQKIFSSEKNQNMLIIGGDAWISSKASCSLSPVTKIVPFLFLCEKNRMSSCITCLIRDSDSPMSLFMDLIDSLGSISIIAWISPKNSGFFSHQNDQSEFFELPYLGNHYWIHPNHLESSFFYSDWHPSTTKSSYRTFRHKCLLYSKLFPNFRVRNLRNGTAFFTYNVQETLVSCIVDKT